MRLHSGLRVLTLVFALTALVSCKNAADTLGIKLKLEKHTLPNGLNVILAEDHTVPIVSYQTWYRVGSVDEHPGITGISHLFEHLMFKGTPKYGPKQFFLQLEAKGAEVNAFTTRDYTVYYSNFVPPLLERVIDMEADRMTNLKLDDEVLASERQVVFEERKMRTDNSPEGRMQEAIWQLAFRRHPYQWPVIGFPQDLEAITLTDLVDYYRAHYQPANATVVIVGDIDPKKTLEMVTSYYSPIEKRPQPKRNFPKEPEQKEERRMEMADHTASERLIQAYHVPSATDEDSYALDVLSNILFEGTSSRAYQRLVDEKDILVGVSGTNYTPSYPGLFMISALLKGGIKAEVAEEELAKLITEVQETDVKPEEISRAIKQLTVQLVDSVRTPYGLGQLIGVVNTVFGDPNRFQSDLAKYFEVTQKDVRRVAQKYLNPNNRSVVILRQAKESKGSAQATATDKKEVRQ